MVNINKIIDIEEGRQLMYELADKKGLNHPQVIRLSQKLDKLIIKELKNNKNQYSSKNNITY